MAAIDVATTLQNCKTMWSGLAAWQAICGVATATEAAERIYIGGTPEDTDSLVPSTVFEIAGIPLQKTGAHFRGTMDVNIWCELEVPNTNNDTYENQYLWVWSKWAALMAEMITTSNTSGGLMLESLRPVQLPGRKDSKVNQGRKEWGFTFAFSTHLV